MCFWKTGLLGEVMSASLKYVDDLLKNEIGWGVLEFVSTSVLETDFGYVTDSLKLLYLCIFKILQQLSFQVTNENSKVVL